MSHTGTDQVLGATVSLSINPATNRINASGYTYDSNGNLTAMPGSTFVYDIENRLAQVTSSGSEYYGYDPSNRRIWKTTTTDGAGKIFFYGAMGELMGTFGCAAGCTTDPPTKVETNLHFAGKLIRWDNAAVVLDRLGGVAKRSNLLASPQIWQDSNYYPFGEERTATGQDRTKFATYYRDNKTGFDYAMNRYYNSSWGRFLTPDPYGPSANPGNLLSWNRYAYVANDPVNENDPSGLFYWPTIGDFGGGGSPEWWDYFPYPSGGNNGPDPDPDPGRHAAKPNKYIAAALKDVESILAGDNSCSKFFGSFAQKALEALGPMLTPTPLNNPNIGIHMVVPAAAEGPYRVPSIAEVNTGGPFLSPFGPSFGGYTHGTEQSRVVQILHELAHLLKNPEGTGWLIPDDGSDPKQSEKNTSTVMDHCKDQIDKVK